MINLGILDRALRAATGAVLIAVALIFPDALWGWAGLGFAATALLAWCPLYSLLGWHSLEPG